MRGRDGGAAHRAFLDATLPHLEALYRIARHAAADPAQADDLVQETYLRAFTHFDQHHGENTRAWLAAICLNAARSQARRESRRPIEAPEAEAGEVVAADAVDELAITALDRAEIETALARLPEPQRWCVLLMDVAGYTARETAEILRCPRGTVLARVHRGRRKLAVLLAGTRPRTGGGHGHA
ncbi:RNA polymerase sigma factor [Amycolatopsis thermophila]|uniref:RNA polymerase sigma factor n=1 Tax=Amycolatopsis thermophila TaxID=206084 RepID=A0ABU0F2P5_9PSEU|nr:RNA polymerase sigma factor [Amycolatopsis thermophila]MDQ0381441.1 RNA polymerase sigma-70 factor (ECF subfamily) [Amycolatopsis thermophila]